MTREEHLAWAKARALQYVEIGELQNAFTSLGSDLSKHPETNNPELMMLGMRLLAGGALATPEAMRLWIEGFN